MNNQFDRMPSDKTHPTALALHLARPYAGISALEITDSLVRGAIYSGATRIEILISQARFQFCHNGPSIPIADIQSNWSREAAKENLDQSSSFGLDVAQLLFMAAEIQVASQEKVARLTLQQVVSGYSWETAPATQETGMSITGIGVSDPWAFVLDGEGESSIFRACPIPVFINGEAVERLEREGNNCFVDVDGVSVFIDLASVQRGFAVVSGGIAYTRPGVNSLVCLPHTTGASSPRMRISEGKGGEWQEKAGGAFLSAVGQVLMRVEAEKGHPFVVERYFQALTIFHPEMLLYSEYVSTKALTTTGKAELPAVPLGMPISRSQLEAIEHPIYCDLPRTGKTSLAHLATVFRLMMGGSAIFVKAGHSLPGKHWLRARAMSLRRGNIKAYSSGNITTPSELLSGQIKLRISDHVFLNLKDGNGNVTSHIVDDWVLAEEEPMTRLDRISIGNAENQMMQVLHINRNCKNLHLPDFPCRPGEREILQQALREASEYMQVRLSIN